MQSGEFTGKPSISSASSSVNSTMGVGAGKVKDRTLIVEFTNENVEEIDGFPVNSLDCMVQDQSVNNTRRNLVGSLCNTFNKGKPSRQTMDGFIHDTQPSFQNLIQERIQDETYIQQKVMEAIIDADGGHIT